jgi:hypothetical protein
MIAKQAKKAKEGSRRDMGHLLVSLKFAYFARRAHLMGALLTIARASTADPPEASRASDSASEVRRQRVLSKLAANPGLRIAVVCDGDGDPAPVAVAIRDMGTCEVLIPAARFDPFALLELAARHSGKVH